MASTHARDGGRLLQVGQPQEAVKSFQKGLAIDPDDVDCLLGLVRTYLSLGVARDAEAAALRLLKVKPDHAEAQGHLAMLRAQAGDAEALESLKALAAAPTSGYFERFNLGGLLLDRGDLEGAKAAYASALQVAPGSAHVHFELGRIHLQQGAPAEAVTHFQKAAEGAPQESMPLLMLSRAHAATGGLGLAIQAGTQALDKAQGGLRRAVLEDLFKLYLSAGSPEGAKRSAVDLRKLDPRDVNYVYMHGLATMSAGTFAEAKALFEEVLGASPDSWPARQALAQVHLALNERTQARQVLEAAVARMPTALEPVNDLVLLLLQDDDAARARAILEHALATHPKEGALHLYMAMATLLTEPAVAAHHARQAQALGEGHVKEQAGKLVEKLGA
ncbi:tetratricopeptide repeat protein [Myxococcus sp. K15C18031901]|uniref:tetratricopeptide repeat protein n=1 Tax=Myxococcus dinghuensis TaxID=2906761 RepID=UPI0020A777A7|nr:tetratricopeptide repeat protein [Myxococcus dinghuensis]MCP3099841.1 tetratricopeptide repeat protein [Myxococcus dinghuensis]